MTIAYDPEVALLVVDVQNDFADPGGSLYVNGGERVVAEINQQVEEASAAGSFVVYTQDWHPEVTPHFKKDGGIWPVHCVGGTWGAEFHPDLVVEGPAVRKGMHGEDGYSGFTMRDPVSGVEMPTDLDPMLREHEINRVVIVGLATDYCVRATAFDALANGYAATVLREAVAAVNLEPDDGALALAEMADAGVDVVDGAQH